MATNIFTQIEMPDGSIYDLAGGTSVEANPSETSTDELSSIKIDGTTYKIANNFISKKIWYRFTTQLVGESDASLNVTCDGVTENYLYSTIKTTPLVVDGVFKLEYGLNGYQWRVTCLGDKIFYNNNLMEINSIIKEWSYEETVDFEIYNETLASESDLDKKMNTSNPTGIGSFSLNRKASTIIGEKSFAEGEDTIASGEASHVEGIYTIADGNCQHVQGKYNIADMTSAFIIGNGTDDNNRSNALTLDWNGNLEVSGKIKDGDGNILGSTEDLDLITKGYKNEGTKSYLINITYTGGVGITGNVTYSFKTLLNGVIIDYSQSGIFSDLSLPYVYGDIEIRTSGNFIIIKSLLDGLTYNNQVYNNGRDILQYDYDRWTFGDVLIENGSPVVESKSGTYYINYDPITGKRLEEKLNEINESLPFPLAIQNGTYGYIKTKDSIDTFIPFNSEAGGSTKFTTLWEGIHEGTENIQLSDNVLNYDFIIIGLSSYYSNSDPERVSNKYEIIPKDKITINEGNHLTIKYSATIFFNTNFYKTYRFGFETETCMVFSEPNGNWESTAITGVYGVKFSSSFSGGFSGIDTDRVIAEITSSVAGTEWTATEDCYLVGELVAQNEVSCIVKVNEVIVNSLWIHQNGLVSGCSITPVKKGQIVKIIACNETFARTFKAYGVLSSGSSSNHTYSTEEQIVGTWIDGKPIYEKTIPIPAGSNDAELISNVNAFVNVNGYVIYADGYTRQIGSNNYSQCFVFKETNNTSVFIHGNNRTGGYVTIQYTKTTG